MKRLSLLTTALLALVALNAPAATPVSFTGTPITENFDGMGPTGTTLPSGWDAGYFNPYIQQGTAGGSGVTTVGLTPVVNDGSAGTTTPIIGNLGTTGAADRALGSFARTSPQGDQFLQLAIQNNSGSPIASFVLSYTGEEWRNSASTVQQLTLWFSATDAINGFVSMGSPFTFNTPNNTGGNVAIDGNLPGNRTVISATYTPAAPIAAGSTFYIRWYDINDNGISDDYLAIDDLTVAPTLQLTTVSASNGDWHTPSTWNPAIVPTLASPVTVNPHAVTITTAAAYCNTLTISGGASVAATGQSLNVASTALGALITTGGTLSLNGTSALNIAQANTSASFAGLTVASGTVLNVTSELTVDANKALSGATINTPKLTLAGGTLTKSDGLSIGTGGLISGNGIVAGTVSVASGGKASPGTDTAVNAFTTTGLTLESGSLLTLNAASSASLDQITVSGSGGLTINGGIITFLSGTGAGPVTTPGTYNLFAYSGVIGGAGVSALSVANPVPGLRYHFGTSGGFVTLQVIQGPLWSGDAGGVWSLAANWSGAAPGPTDTLVFSASGKSGSSVNDLTGASFPSIQFESGVSAFTLSGNKVILTGDLGGAIVVNNSANLQTLSLPIQIGSSLAVYAASNAVTLSGEVSGTGTLVKSGANTLTLSGANLHSGGTTLSNGTLNINSATALGATASAFTISGGTINNNSANVVTLANNNPINWNGDFTFTGTTNLNLGAGAVTMNGSRTATVSAQTLTVGGTITGTGTLTKRGAGTLALNGAGSAVTKFQVYGGGTLQIGSGAAATSTSTADIYENLSTLQISSGSFTSGGGDEAHDGARCSVLVEGTGSLTSNGEWLMGRNMGSASLILKDNAVMNATGALRLGRDNIRDNYVSLRNSAQATVGSVVVFDSSYYGEGGQGSGSVLEVNDTASLTAGSMTVANFLGNTATAHPRYGNGQVYQSGGTVTINGNISMGVQVSQAGDVIIGTYNLNGGVLQTRQINNGTAAIPGTANLNFHGGTLAYNDAVDQPDYVSLGASGSLYLYEGVTIDDGGQAVTITQAMLSPNSGQGLAAMTLATPIGAVAAYSMTPEVLITGGGGSGATAIAVLNGSGQVSAIKVTNPGLGYSSTPTVQLFFQGAATAVPSGSISLAANTYTGGLAKTGLGVLTLSAANTYTGSTVVSNGTLLVNGSIAGGATVKPGAKLGGTGIIAGAVTVESTGDLAPGASAGTITISSDLTLNSSATCTYELDAFYNGANDQTVVTGTAHLHGNGIQIAGPATLDTAGDYVLMTAGAITGDFDANPAWLGTPPDNAPQFVVVKDGSSIKLRHVTTPIPTLNGLTAGPLVGQLTVSLSTAIGGAVVTEKTLSLNPTDWQPIQTNTVPGGATSFSIPLGTEPAAFFRLKGQ